MQYLKLITTIKQLDHNKEKQKAVALTLIAFLITAVRTIGEE